MTPQEIHKLARTDCFVDAQGCCVPLTDLKRLNATVQEFLSFWRSADLFRVSWTSPAHYRLEFEYEANPDRQELIAFWDEDPYFMRYRFPVRLMDEVYHVGGAVYAVRTRDMKWTAVHLIKEIPLPMPESFIN